MKTLSTAILSFLLFGCAGSPPKMERKIKQYNGAPELGSICRLNRSEIAKIAKSQLKTQLAKDQVNAIVKQGFVADDKECIRADDPKFAEYGAFSYKDIGVLLRYQENLLYACEKWKPTVSVRKDSDGPEEAQNPDNRPQ